MRPALESRRSVLHIHRAERADGLVDALATLLAEPPDDPFAREVVAVPTRGMERWLTQRLSTRLGTTAGGADGVCANVDFPSPRRLVGDAVAAASGIDPESDPWLAERIVWPLLEVVETALAEPWLRVLAAHLGASPDAPDEARRARRLSSVRHIAELFDRYARHRPEMLEAWSRGDDAAVPGDALWQAELWRRLRARVDAPDPAARLNGACRRLREEPARVDLPERLSLFGLTRLPAATLGVLAALAAGREVHLFVLHPSPALWDRVADLVGPQVRRRADDPTAYLATNRLLGSWGQDARELQLVLQSAADDSVDHHHPVRHGATTLLERIQADVRADRVPTATTPLEADDRSIQVHACHGRSRQVEVLRGAILHLLEEDPTLEPRDVIVMCPDIETFAPLIQATFGAGEIPGIEDDPLPDDIRPPDLRVRLADRSLRQTNPILGVVGALLDLAGGRATASEVLDLADRAPVRRRFGFDDDDLSRIEDWVAGSGIRWGLDAAHRAPFKLDKLDAGTWRAGLDRVLLGVTMSETLLGGVLALDDVDSGSIDLAGRLAELVDRLQAALDSLTTPQPIDAWARQHRDRRRRAHRHDRRRRMAARRAAAPARRRGRRGDHRQRGQPDGARAGRGPRAARRAPRRPPDARELPHRTSHGLHAHADALGAASRRVPARPRRRRLPAPDRPRRRRPHPRRPACRRPRPPRRGPPAPARRAARGPGPARHHVHRQRRAHEHRAPAGGAGRRAARRDRRDRIESGWRPSPRQRPRPPSPAALRPARLRARPARGRACRGASIA